MPGRRGSDSESESVHTEYIGTFETLRDEGEHFVHVAQYKRAIDTFTKALDMKSEDKQCLVTRSQCYLKLGDAQSSLADAEAALQQDSKFIRAIYQKAQALYQMGDFETALVFYHRGNTVRPELDEFRLGIQKSQEAITNSIGTPDSVKLKGGKDIDLTEFYREQERSKKVQTKGGYQKPQIQAKQAKQDRSKKPKPDNEKTIQQLLGELYGDKAFLESLLNDEAITGQNTETSIEVKGLVVDCLDYLDTRTDFWRQQKPLYARKRDRDLRLRGPGAGKKKEPTKYILKQLGIIDDAQADGKYEESLDQAKKTLKKVESWSHEDISNKQEILANLNSLIGNAYLEMGESNKALQHHEKDLAIAEESNLADAKSRALDNIGRVYARRGSYDKAVEIWKRKLPMDKTTLESAWLFHELGRCYLELQQFEYSKDYGEKSLDAAKDAEDLDWQLHAMVLVAQSEVKLGDMHAAIDSFERALEFSQANNDEKAEQAIKNAISDVNDKIVKGMKDEDEKTEDTAKEDSAKEDSANEHLAKEHSDREHSEKGHSEKEHHEKEHTEKEQSERGHSAKRHSDKGHSDKGHSEKGHSEKGHPENGHPEKEHSAKEHSAKEHSEKGHSEKGHSEKGHPAKEHSAKEHSEKEHSANDNAETDEIKGNDYKEDFDEKTKSEDSENDNPKEHITGHSDEEQKK